MKFDLIHTDTCLSDYFSGDSRPFFTLPIYSHMNINEICEHLISELSQGALGGSLNFDVQESELFHYLAEQAIKQLKMDCIERNGIDYIYFKNVEEPEEEDCDVPTAFFVLTY